MASDDIGNRVESLGIFFSQQKRILDNSSRLSHGAISSARLLRLLSRLIDNEDLPIPEKRAMIDQLFLDFERELLDLCEVEGQVEASCLRLTAYIVDEIVNQPLSYRKNVCESRLFLEVGRESIKHSFCVSDLQLLVRLTLYELTEQIDELDLFERLVPGAEKCRFLRAVKLGSFYSCLALELGDSDVSNPLLSEVRTLATDFCGKLERLTAHSAMDLQVKEYIRKRLNRIRFNWD